MEEWVSLYLFDEPAKAVVDKLEPEVHAVLEHDAAKKRAAQVPLPPARLFGTAK